MMEDDKNILKVMYYRGLSTTDGTQEGASSDEYIKMMNL